MGMEATRQPNSPARRGSDRTRGATKPMKSEFIAATLAEQERTGGPAEICAVLNRLPQPLLAAPDHELIEKVDALMDTLYREGTLLIPGHRWLTTPPPTIRHHLVTLHTTGNIHRHPTTGKWTWTDATSRFRTPTTQI